MIGNHEKRHNIVFRDPQKTLFIFDMFLHDFFVTLGVISGSSRSGFFVVFWCLKLEVPPDRPKDPFLKDRAPIMIRSCITNYTRM